MAPEAAAEMKTSAAMPMVIDVLLLMRGLLDAMVDCSLLITSSYRRLDAASSRAEEEVVGDGEDSMRVVTAYIASTTYICTAAFALSTSLIICINYYLIM